MFDIGMPELVLIFVVALLVFGPKRLPEIGKSLGRALHQLKKSTNEFKQNLEEEVGTTEIKEELLKQQRELQTSLTQAVALEPQPTGAKKEEAAVPAAETAQPEKPQENKSYAG